ncbi:MAG: DUF1273 domain-containing protein [Clostridiales bacterium]|nr:DUF1273 domain-containing protein [Clostridiales bacterium]
MEKKICAITGVTPDDLDYGYDEEDIACVETKAAIADQLLHIIGEGCTTFMSSLEQGAEMWGAEACAAIRALGGKIDLICVPTDELQAKRWHPERRERYYKLFEECTDVVTVDDSNEYILENATHVLAVGKSTPLTEEAEKRGIKVIKI